MYIPFNMQKEAIADYLPDIHLSFNLMTKTPILFRAVIVWLKDFLPLNLSQLVVTNEIEVDVILWDFVENFLKRADSLR